MTGFEVPNGRAPPTGVHNGIRRLRAQRVPDQRDRLSVEANRTRTLERALDKVERYQQPPQPDVRALARELAAQLSPSPSWIGSRQAGERTTLLEVARMTHFVARDKLTFAVVGGRDHVVDLTLSQLEERLDSRRFIRIHRATIVNTGFVQELYPAVDGGVLVRLKDDLKTELSLARDRVRDLKTRLGISRSPPSLVAGHCCSQLSGEGEGRAAVPSGGKICLN
jgi:DNA-binding LytR/AlgR family response regulator